MNPAPRHPFRLAVFRGLGALLPPLLTVLILLWVINTTKSYVLDPVNNAVREGLVWFLADIHPALPGMDPAKTTFTYNGTIYHRLDSGTYIPQVVYNTVMNSPASGTLPANAEDFYRRYVDLKYLKSWISVPFFLAIFILLLYLLGKLLTVGIGIYFGHLFESGVRLLPLVRNVYSAAKQISDFLFSKREFEFTRIVAVEHPRKGIWSVGFVTSEGLPEIRELISEPMVTVLIPYSPLPVTGCTITVRKNECIDLNITFDQACEYIVSCGVVIPHQRLEPLRTSGGASAVVKK